MNEWKGTERMHRKQLPFILKVNQLSGKQDLGLYQHTAEKARSPKPYFAKRTILQANEKQEKGLVRILGGLKTNVETSYPEPTTAFHISLDLSEDEGDLVWLLTSTGRDLFLQ